MIILSQLRLGNKFRVQVEAKIFAVSAAIAARKKTRKSKSVAIHTHKQNVKKENYTNFRTDVNCHAKEEKEQQFATRICQLIQPELQSAIKVKSIFT